MRVEPGHDFVQPAPSDAAAQARAAHPHLTWIPWYMPPAPPAAQLPDWTACTHCGTRRSPTSTQGRDATGQLRVVIACCPDCGQVTETTLVPTPRP